MAQHVHRLRPSLKETMRRRIKLTRTQRGWSLSELGERASISKQALHMIEEGIQHPSIGTLDLIAEALGVKMGYLLGEIHGG